MPTLYLTQTSINLLTLVLLFFTLSLYLPRLRPKSDTTKLAIALITLDYLTLLLILLESTMAQLAVKQGR